MSYAALRRKVYSSKLTSAMVVTTGYHRNLSLSCSKDKM